MAPDFSCAAMFRPVWEPPPAQINLADADIHLWWADLEDFLSTLQGLWQTLSPDEQARAERFRFERDRQRFIICRGVLRTLLGRYLGCGPSQIGFTYGVFGKPALAAQPIALQFNLSHSGDRALYAVTAKHPIGVDLEQCRPLDVPALARSFFSPQECEFLCSLPDSTQLTQFFHLWTCKEALLKTTGQGVSALKQVEFWLDSKGSVCLQARENSAEAIADWLIQPLVPAVDFIAAFTVKRQSWKLCCYQIEPIC
jgi:4'-phosphopantetheinyl transferase